MILLLELESQTWAQMKADEPQKKIIIHGQLARLRRSKGQRSNKGQMRVKKRKKGSFVIYLEYNRFKTEQTTIHLP